MKKVLNIFLCIGLLFQTFFSVLPVYAEDDRLEKLEINSITQDGKELEIKDGVYLVDGTDRIVLNYTLKNISDNASYKLCNEREGNTSCGYIEGRVGDYNGIEYNVGLDINSKITDVKYVLYDGDSNDVLDTKALKFDFVKFDEYNLSNSNLYVTELSQGGNVLEPIVISEGYDYKYILNSSQDINIKLVGENFNDNVTYPLYLDFSNFIGNYTGKELNDGIELVYKVNEINNGYKNLNYGIRFDMYNECKYAYSNLCSEKSSSCTTYEFINEEDMPNYNLDLSYKNYDNKINLTSDFNGFYNDYYLVSSRYHNTDNPLVVSINGSNYLDMDYNVTLVIKRDNETLYNTNFDINGLLLNEGYNLELDDFVSSNDKSYIEDKDKFIVEANINYVSNKIEYMYGYSDKYSTITSEIFFENGKKNLSTFRGNGSYYYDSGFADTNRDVFNEFGNIYIRYVGSCFDDEEYNYELSYGYSDNNGGLYKSNVLETGTVNGTYFNNNGLMFAVDNKNDYRYPTYRLEIKHGDEVIYYSSPVLDLVDFPTFANVSLTNSNNKDLYLRMDDYSYVATRNFPIKLAINGIGFDNDKEYKIVFSETYRYSDGSFDHDTKDYTFSGKKINEGKATINLGKEITEDMVSADLYAMYNMDNGYGQGGFTLNFVDSKDFFPTDIPYLVDNGSDLIKNIKGKTSIDEFTSTMTSNGNKVKIFDKTGTFEQTKYVGTGMIARVVDEYDNALIDLDVVVKGDVSGDGNISITDLVNMKQHLAEIKELKGLYEMAGKITGGDSIGITDLVKVGRSVANDEVIE